MVRATNHSPILVTVAGSDPIASLPPTAVVAPALAARSLDWDVGVNVDVVVDIDGDGVVYATVDA